MRNDFVTIIKRIEKLEKAVFGSVSAKNTKQEKSTASMKEFNFSLNERAFVKKYATAKSGPKKFTILLSYLTGGKPNKSVELSEIRKHWNKMSAKNLLGKFNMSHTDRAKISGWVDSKQYGIYFLTNEWKNVL